MLHNSSNVDLKGKNPGVLLSPMRKKKLDRKKKLEKIRKNRHVTIIQAQWRGKLARARKRVQPEENITQEDKKTDLNNPLNQNNSPEVEEKPEIDDSVERHPSLEEKDQSPEGIKRVESSHLDKRKSQAEVEQEHAEKLLSLAEKQGTEGEGNLYTQLIFAVVMLSVYFGGGTIFYGQSLDISYFQAFYFNIITVTTIGYGEISPDSDVTKVVTAFNIFAGLAIFTIALTFLLDFLQREKEKLEEKLIANKFEEENRIEMEVKKGVDNNEEENSEENDDVQNVTLFTKLREHVQSYPEDIRNALYNMFVAISTIILTDLFGAIFVMFVVEDLKFIDAIYFCAVTISSVGYGDTPCLYTYYYDYVSNFLLSMNYTGDILPSSDRARLFIIFYGIIGTGMTANALTKFSAGEDVIAFILVLFSAS